MKDNQRQLLVKCPNCAKKYYMQVKEEYLGKTIRVNCLNVYCSSKIIQEVPKSEDWQDRKTLYSINPKDHYIKYYNAKNDIEEFPWNRSSLVIGRKPQDQLGFDSLKIMDPSVSSRHCVLGMKWDLKSQIAMYRIKDLQSTNGTYVNGQKLQPKVKYDLNEGDLILAGNFQLLFSIK